jgi:hypothetical protein
MVLNGAAKVQHFMVFGPKKDARKCANICRNRALKWHVLLHSQKNVQLINNHAHKVK